MYATNANLRPAYADNEISNLFHEKRMHNGNTIEALAKQFGSSLETIENIDQYKYDFSMNMIEIASKYLNIPVEKLTEIIEDDDDSVSCRGCEGEKTEVLIDIVNILFNEMIMQKKISV